MASETARRPTSDMDVCGDCVAAEWCGAGWLGGGFSLIQPYGDATILLWPCTW